MASNEKQLINFLNRISKLSSFEFFGVAKMMGVNLFEENDPDKPVATELIMSEVIDKYVALNRTQRKNLDIIVKSALKKK